MSLSDMTQNSHNDGFNLYFAQVKSKIDGKELDTPVILIQDAKTKEKTRHGLIRGFVDGIKFKTFEYEGKVIPQYQVSIVNPLSKDRILFDVAFSVLGRTFMNTILGIEDFETSEYQIAVFKNKAGYPGIAIQNGENRCEWKYARADLPEAPKVKVNGDEISDFTALNEFYTKAMDKMIAEAKFFQVPTETQEAAEQVFGEGFPSSEIAPPPFDPES